MVEKPGPESQREVQRLLGRCLIRLQQYELLLKSLIARSEVSGAAHELESRLVERVADVEKATLGSLMKSLFEEVVVVEGLATDQSTQATTHNAYSIGIELWRNQHQTGYTAWQYDAVSQLVYDILRRHSIPRSSITGHGFFDRSRRGEPKDFDWAQLDDDLDRLNQRVKSFDASLSTF